MVDPASSTTPTSWLPNVISAATNLVLVLVGYIASQISERAKDKRALEREREAREANRRYALAERRIEFQRKTLLNLQAALMQLVRAYGETHQFDVMQSRAAGKWTKSLLPDELNAREFNAGVQVTKLRVRVRDEILRNAIKRLRDSSYGITVANSEAQSTQALNSSIEIFEFVSERLGELLRTLDDEEEASGR